MQILFKLMYKLTTVFGKQVFLNGSFIIAYAFWDINR